MVLPSKVWEDFFQKKSISLRDKIFFGKKTYGEVVLNRRSNDQIMPRFGSSFINDKCIFQLPVDLIWKLNLHLNIKPLTMSYYKIIDVFSPKCFNNWEISKIVSRSVFFILTLTWDIDILFEKLRQGDEFFVWEIPFSANMPLWVGFHWKSVAWRQKNKQRLYYLWDLEVGSKK